MSRATQEVTSVGSLHFSIDGEWLTETVRSLVLEGRWRHALSVLADGLRGISTDQALSVLRGECKLVGVNEVELVPEDAQGATEYIETLTWQLAGLWRRSIGELLQPYAVVTSFDRRDLPSSRENPWATSEDFDLRRLNDLSRQRQIFYADDPQRDVATLTGRWSILWRRVDDPPLWIRGVDTAEQALADFEARGRHLEERGALQVQRPPEDDDEGADEEEEQEEKAPSSFPRTTAARLGLPAEFQPAVDALFGPEEPDTKPEPDPELSAEGGYILPGGDFYGCAYMKHRDLADRLLRHAFSVNVTDPQQEADRRNWLRIQKSLGGEWLILSPKGKPTKRQERTLMGWCAKHGAPYPQELLG